jgi:hypothetical protein
MLPEVNPDMLRVLCQHQLDRPFLPLGWDLEMGCFLGTSTDNEKLSENLQQGLALNDLNLHFKDKKDGTMDVMLTVSGRTMCISIRHIAPYNKVSGESAALPMCHPHVQYNSDIMEAATGRSMLHAVCGFVKSMAMEGPSSNQPCSSLAPMDDGQKMLLLEGMQARLIPERVFSPKLVVEMFMEHAHR